jgi:hypothetical protein
MSNHAKGLRRIHGGGVGTSSLVPAIDASSSSLPRRKDLFLKILEEVRVKCNVIIGGTRGIADIAGIARHRRDRNKRIFTAEATEAWRRQSLKRICSCVQMPMRIGLFTCIRGHNPYPRPSAKIRCKKCAAC